jgi:hypothetical protein
VDEHKSWYVWRVYILYTFNMTKVHMSMNGGRVVSAQAAEIFLFSERLERMTIMNTYVSHILFVTLHSITQTRMSLW